MPSISSSAAHNLTPRFAESGSVSGRDQKTAHNATQGMASLPVDHEEAISRTLEVGGLANMMATSRLTQAMVRGWLARVNAVREQIEATPLEQDNTGELTRALAQRMSELPRPHQEKLRMQQAERVEQAFKNVSELPFEERQAALLRAFQQQILVPERMRSQVTHMAVASLDSDLLDEQKLATFQQVLERIASLPAAEQAARVNEWALAFMLLPREEQAAALSLFLERLRVSNWHGAPIAEALKHATYPLTQIWSEQQRAAACIELLQHTNFSSRELADVAAMAFAYGVVNQPPEGIANLTNVMSQKIGQCQHASERGHAFLALAGELGRTYADRSTDPNLRPVVQYLFSLLPQMRADVAEADHPDLATALAGLYRHLPSHEMHGALPDVVALARALPEQRRFETLQQFSSSLPQFTQAELPQALLQMIELAVSLKDPNLRHDALSTLREDMRLPGNASYEQALAQLRTDREIGLTNDPYVSVNHVIDNYLQDDR